MTGLFSTEPGDDGLPAALRRPVLAALVLSTVIMMLDTTMVNVALPSMAQALGVDPAYSIWVAQAAALASAMSMVAFAALGDVVGFKRLFTAGLAVFTLASLGSALSPSLPWLLACRTVQGVGAAAAMSIAPALYRIAFPGRLLGSVLGVNALVVAASTAFGPTIGGLLLSVVTWPWLFVFNLPFALAALWLGARALPADAGRGGRFDAAGAAWSALAMGAAIVALNGHLHQGWVTRLAAALAALAALALFIARQHRASAPLLPLGLFASARFTAAAAVSFCAFVGQGIAFVAVPFLLQHTYGYSPLQSALLFTPWPLAIGVAAPLAGRLADRYSSGMLSTAGLAILAVGLALLAAMGPDAQLHAILWRAFVCGAGFGLFQTPNNREMLGTVARAHLGAASGVLALARTFGQTVGMALAALALAAAAGAPGIRLALGGAAATAALAGALSAWRAARHAPR
jgi:DHA2 family multidrug resistance protein-like MFS transporter